MAAKKKTDKLVIANLKIVNLKAALKDANAEADHFEKLASNRVQLMKSDEERYERQEECYKKALAESEASRKAWCEKTVALEQRCELAEDALRQLLDAMQKVRPSQPVVVAEAPQLVAGPTLGEPGDGDVRRYSREVTP